MAVDIPAAGGMKFQRPSPSSGDLESTHVGFYHNPADMPSTSSRHSPVRKIPIGTRSVTGTMPGGEKFESTLERDLMYLLRFDLNVNHFIAQPVKIEFQDKDGGDRSYTPDILIHYRQGLVPPVLAEVKYRDELRKNFQELRPKFKAAIRYAKEHGWRFKIFTDREIRTPYLANAKFLLAYMIPAQSPSDDIMRIVLDQLRGLQKTDAETLLASIYQDKWEQAELLPVVWHLVATRRIGCDLTTPITMRSQIWHRED